MFTPLAVATAPHSSRRLIVVDLENVVGGALLNADAADWAKQHILATVTPRPNDLIVVGVAHNGLICAGCAWPNLRYVVGSGPDGADLALLDVLDENVDKRFNEVIVVSGDGIFTDHVTALAAAGVRVTVVSHPTRLAKRLRMAAHAVRFLPEPCYPGTLGDAA